MGYDVTYHPIAPHEMHELYFRGIDDAEQPQKLASAFSLDEEQLRSLQGMFETAGSELAGDATFNGTHGLQMAAVLGVLRPYWYIRGGAFSFAIEAQPRLKDYVADWKSLVPPALANLEFEPLISENYMVGVYLASDGLKRLKQDYGSKDIVRAAIDSTFSEGRLPIFWKAVDFAVANQLGLIEATDLVVPNPFDLNKSQFSTDPANLDVEGLNLYVQAAKQQLQQAVNANSAAGSGKVGGWFKRLFRG